MSVGPTVVTIGNFDGVHRGHAALIGAACTRAAEGKERARVLAMAFDPHPAERLRPGSGPGRLSTWAQRTEWMRRLGAERVARLEPSDEMLGREPEQFIEWLVEQFGPVAIVEGSDFRFGKGRRGDMAMLREIGRARGIDVIEVPEVTAILEDHSIVRVSSSMVRWLVANGRVRDAAALLGRPYTISGHVVQGEQRGRTIGYPTANIETTCMPARDGVYAGRAVLGGPGGTQRSYAAAVSIGTKPTFGEKALCIEACLLEGSPSVPAKIGGLYGEPIELELIGWVRDQVKFDSVEVLVEQLDRDRGRVSEVLR